MISRRCLTALAACLAGAAACGSEIGDECSRSTDCSTDGTRACDTASAGGYCTIMGCDYDTCPDEAVCIRFFTGSFANRPCDPATEDTATDMCAVDELCPLEGFCVPRAAEVRYCMRSCDSGSDCRDGYECRDLELMKAHGGEPALAPGQAIGSDPPRFCGQAPS